MDKIVQTTNRGLFMTITGGGVAVVHTWGVVWCDESGIAWCGVVVCIGVWSWCCRLFVMCGEV